MKWTPKPYQIRGIKTLVKQCGAGLFLDPGMRKTSTTLAAFGVLRECGYAKKMLVIAPIKPMYGTWRQEGTKWDCFNYLTFTLLHGTKKEEALKEDVDIYIINPEGIAWLTRQEEIPDWDVLCVDESTKFKNSQSVRFKLLRKMLPKFYYRWILTGTSSPNGLEDLFSQVYIMDLGKTLGEYITHYRNKYFYKVEKFNYIPNLIPSAIKEITKSIAHMVLKLNAEDYLSMPKFNRVIRKVYLPEKIMKIYKEIEKEFITQLKTGTIVADNKGIAGTKCRQIANGNVYDENSEIHYVHKEKLLALEEIIEETNGLPILIIYEFKHDLTAIESLLGSAAVCITGMKGTKFIEIQDKFNRGEIRYLITHAGGTHGINIHGACYHMIFYGITWNLEYYIQSVWRLYRDGQLSKMVLCYMLVAADTLDEVVVRKLDHKKAEQGMIDNCLIEYAYNEDN